MSDTWVLKLLWYLEYGIDIKKGEVSWTYVLVLQEKKIEFKIDLVEKYKKWLVDILLIDIIITIKRKLSLLIIGCIN